MLPTGQRYSANNHKVVKMWSQRCLSVVQKLSLSWSQGIPTLSQNCFKAISKLCKGFPKLSRSFLEVALKMFSRCPKVFPKLTQNCFICVQRLSMLLLSCAIHILFEICVSHRLQTASTSLRSTSKIQVLSKFSNDH